MNFQYNCPKCRKKLISVKNIQQCNSCGQGFTCDDNLVIFKNHNFSNKLLKNNSVIELVKIVKRFGYKTGTKKFLITNNELKSQLINTQYDKSADIIFHGIGKDCSRCLDINGGLGNKAEILSNIFGQVYLIEFDDNLIELQKIRFKENECSNISITKCDIIKLPFPDNFFDLILYDEILDDVTRFFKTDNQEEILKQLLQELKRVVSEEGCIIFETNNNLRGLINKKNSKYVSILEKEGLIVKPYWTLPSYNAPYYSGEIYNSVTLKAFFKNINTFVSALQGGKNQSKIKGLVLSIFKNLNYPFIKTIIQIFSPSLVFCCWKKNNPNSLERWIKEETGYENILRMSRQEKNLFMLLNSKGEIEKAVYIKRYGHEIPNKIKFFERKFPNIKNPNERIWKVDWLKGRPINPKNKHEIIATIDELIEFQKKTKLEKMDKNDVFEEIMFIKKGLEYYGYNDIKYFEWLEQYEKFIDQNQISMTPVHGDFWFSNVVYDPETKKINMIDWDTYSEKGNPYEDFIWFLCHFMGMTSKDPKLKFKKYLDGRGEMNEVFVEIKNKINLHFGFKLDFILLLRVYLMKWLVVQKQIQESMGGEIIEFEKKQPMIHTEILEILSEY